MTNDAITVLSRTALFRGLSEEEVARIAPICRKLAFEEGSTIVREGETGDTMYLIAEGTVKVDHTLVLDESEESETLGNKVFAKLSADDEHHPLFGELSLLEDAKRTATITTLTDCTLYEIGRDDFLAFVNADPPLGCRVLLNLAAIIGYRLKRTNEDVIKLTTVLSIVLRETP